MASLCSVSRRASQTTLGQMLLTPAVFAIVGGSIWAGADIVGN